MNIYGVDFTSSPSRRKPITVAHGSLNDSSLTIHAIDALTSLPAFDDLVKSKGPWIAGIDFPFGQPRKYVLNVDWPLSWCEYVHHVGSMAKEAYVDQMREYQRDRPKGDVRHFRAVDRLAGACSPMQLDFIPVARMFYAGAPKLLGSGCSVYPFLTNDRTKIAVEAYPSMVARFCVGNRPYKTDNRKKQTIGHKEARKAIVGALNASTGRDSPIRTTYKTEALVESAMQTVMIEDGTGDSLDAVLCALQTAWAYSRQETDFGLNWNCDPLEGWIADPVLLSASALT